MKPSPRRPEPKRASVAGSGMAAGTPKAPTVPKPLREPVPMTGSSESTRSTVNEFSAAASRTSDGSAAAPTVTGVLCRHRWAHREGKKVGAGNGEVGRAVKRLASKVDGNRRDGRRECERNEKSGTGEEAFHESCPIWTIPPATGRWHLTNPAKRVPRRNRSAFKHLGAHPAARMSQVQKILTPRGARQSRQEP